MVKILDLIKDDIYKCVAELGYEVVDLEYKKTQIGDTIIVYCDNATNNISIDECVLITENISKILDDHNLNEALSVSSPGLDRPLKTTKDFERNLGKNIDISLFKPLDGNKKFIAKLSSFNDNEIEIEYKNKKYIIQMEDIAKIKQAIEF